MGHVKPRNRLAVLEKLLQRTIDGLVMNKKKRSIYDSNRYL